MKIAFKAQGSEQGERFHEPVDSPSPALAAAFAFGGISLGQFYNGHVIRGTIWGLLFIALLGLMAEGRVPFAIAPFFLCACSLDAWSTAGEMEAGTIPARRTSRFFWIQATLMVSAITAWSLVQVGHLLQIP